MGGDDSESGAKPARRAFVEVCQAPYNENVRLLPLLLAAACAAHGSIEMTREVDGAWVHAFAGDFEATYHAAARALDRQGWTVVRADPIGGSLSAKSPVESGALNVWYRLAHVVVEPHAPGVTRVRLGLLKTHEYAGGGREPNNDRTVSDRGDYEEIFLAIRRELGQ
jgi:hypothetical protein